MKRVLSLLALAFCVVALTSFNVASAGPQGKTLICHCNPDMDDGLPAMHVIEVANSAVDAHLDHGDCLAFTADPMEVGSACTCIP